MKRLRKDREKIGELMRTGDTYISTVDKGDYRLGAILVNSPEGFYHITVKLKLVDGQWVIVE